MLGEVHGERYQTNLSRQSNTQWPQAVVGGTVCGVEQYPEYVELDGPVSLFVDAEHRAILIAAGEIDRFEMADRVYLAVAPIVGVAELEERLEREAGSAEMRLMALALRTDWRSVRSAGEGMLVGPAGAGAPVTICSLDGLIAVEEIAGN